MRLTNITVTPVSLASIDRPPSTALNNTETDPGPPLCLEQSEVLVVFHITYQPVWQKEICLPTRNLPNQLPKTARKISHFATICGIAGKNNNQGSLGIPHHAASETRNESRSSPILIVLVFRF